MQESTVFIRSPCATTHTVEKKLTTFSIAESSTRMTALSRRAKEVKREIQNKWEIDKEVAEKIRDNRELFLHHRRGYIEIKRL